MALRRPSARDLSTRRRVALSLVLLIVLAASITSAGSGASAHRAAGGTFVMTNLADPDPIDPALVSHTMSRTFVRNVYETLVYYKLGTTTIVPVLATSWKKKRLTYTFQLRRGVKFQNGAPFTSADVKATIDRDLALKSGVGGSYLQNVKSARTSGKYAVKITLKKPYAFFLGLLPKIPIASAKDIKAHMGSPTDYAQAWFKNNANGTGPWKLQSYARGQQYTLVRNPHYWRKFSKNAFTKIVVRPVGDSATQAQLISRGEVHLGSWMSFRDMISAANSANAKLFDFHSPMTLILNITGGKAPLSDSKLRQAMIAAFPYAQMRQFYQGYAQAPRSVLSPTFPGAAKLPILQQNLDRARQLLADAGYPGGKGLRTLRYVAVQGLEDERQAGLLLQSALARIGVELKIDVLPFGTFLAQAQNVNTAPDFSPGYEAPETNDPFQWFTKLFACGGFLNLAHFCSKALDSTIAQAQRTESAKKRIQLLHKAQNLIASNGFAIPAANFDGLYVGASWLGGLKNDISDLLYDPKFFGMYRK